ncbi:MAG TPA: FAD-linked oxidase C-terminal domain-containing protein, partial [Clostridia bacterium]|nr:FAD-linked oxidase C-terminal domain-containing protein [Clostridia bacterium]
RQTCALVQAALEAGMPVVPRGAGTGLAGGAIGEGLVVDFSRYNRRISDLDLEQRTVRVEPGVVLDELNRFLRPHGFRFGPDVATSSRATLGGMIANNSSGSHTPAYGTTADHLSELEVVTAEGQIVMVGPGHDTLHRQRELMRDLAYFHALEIEHRMPGGLLKRRPGYGIDRSARELNNLNHLLCGSEGTLAAITSATLKIVPVPDQKGLILIFFGSIAEAMEAMVELLPLRPAAIELIDRILLDQTRGQLEFQAARDLLDLDRQPCEGLLAVEFFHEVEDCLAAVAGKTLGQRTMRIENQVQANRVWALRKAGLSLLTGCKGSAKPVTCIEDTAVRPEQLPEFVAELQRLMRRLNLVASFYGHAAAGLLHVRPVLDLHSPQDLVRFRQIAEEVSILVRQFKGSLAAEHGVGIARTEFMPCQLGDGLMGVMREIKHAFDPYNLFNPGKIIPAEEDYRIDTNLRLGAGHALQLPFVPTLAFQSKDESFVGNLEQCNGCGGCRKETPTMCPTFLATGHEQMTTRGRANIIRAVLEGRGSANGNPLSSSELQTVLSSCLACKACMTECPSNVNLALLKTELLHGRIQQNGLSLRQRVFSSVDLLGSLGCRFPWLANLALDFFLVRRILSKLLGLAWQRDLPHYTPNRFDHWFKQHPPERAPFRGRVLLWDDTFVRYHEPHIGIAAVKVLEAAGYQVELVRGRKCCGRPAFSQGHVDRARKLGAHNLSILKGDADQAPILFLEPSCYSMFVQDYREMKLSGADTVARRCFLFEQFVEDLLAREPGALQFKHRPGKIVIHAHCHLKAIMSPEFLRRLAQRVPHREVTLLDTGCCGMAGAFGATKGNYELSLKVAEPLVQAVRAQPLGTTISASGTSCRQQISHLTPARARHMAEVLAEALE